MLCNKTYMYYKTNTGQMFKRTICYCWNINVLGGKNNASSRPQNYPRSLFWDLSESTAILVNTELTNYFLYASFKYSWQVSTLRYMTFMLYNTIIQYSGTNNFSLKNDQYLFTFWKWTFPPIYQSSGGKYAATLKAITIHVAQFIWNKPTLS